MAVIIYKVHLIISQENFAKLGCLKSIVSLTIQSLPTCLFGNLCKGLHAFLSIASFRCKSRHIIPAQGLYNVYHGLSLKGIRWDDSREEVIAPIITKLGSRGCITNLRYLKWQENTMWEHTRRVGPTHVHLGQAIQKTGLEQCTKWVFCPVTILHVHLDAPRPFLEVKGIFFCIFLFYFLSIRKGSEDTREHYG